MKITELRLQNFRNYDQASINFSAPLNLLVGENAQGKTNLAEGIFLLTLGRSFRTNKVASLISYDQTEAMIGGKIEYSNKQQQLGVRLSKKVGQKRAFYLAGEQVTAKDFFGQFLAVVFRPRDVSELCLNPAWRRNLLDYILCLVWPGYFQDLVTFRRVLRSRNALLSRLGEHAAQTDQLLFWDEELLRLAAEISRARFDLVEHYATSLPYYYQQLSGEQGGLTVRHHTQVAGEEDLRSNWRAVLAANWAQEKRLGFTISGPHRDDLSFKLANRSLRENGSGGEWRSVLLALKLAEADYLYKQRGERAVILLDDVLSELDLKRREALLGQLEGYQSFITTTEVPSFLVATNKIEIKQVQQGKVFSNLVGSHD